ncbi:MAG TPA: extracellular solute-binding protein [Thermodesulfobacteriota bacterium]|nr:extracellular solute-binding protein [Thermodesulfobacteriota bacterium]
MKKALVWTFVFAASLFLGPWASAQDLNFKYPQEVLDWAKEVKAKVGGQKITVASIEITAMDAWKKMAPDFEKLTGIQVGWYSVELSKLHDRYLLDNAGKTGLFDIMYCSKAFGYSLREMGAIESIQPWLDNQKAVKTPAWFDYKDFIGPLRFANEDLNGKAFAFPATGECAVMAYRKDLFEEYKQPYPKTWQDVLKTAKFFNDKKIKKDNVQVYGIVMRGRPAFGGANFPVPLVGFNWGAKLYDYKTKKVVWDSPEAVASLEFLVELVKNGHPQISSLSATESTSSFAGGQGATCLEVSALMPVVENPKTSKVAGKVHYEPVPMGPKNDFNTISGAGLAMSSQTKNKDAAYAFLVWMLSRANGNIYVDNGGAVVRSSLITKRKADIPYYDATIKGFDQAQKMLDAGWDAQPKTRWTMAWTNTFAKYGSGAFAGQMTPKDAVKSMQVEFEEAMMR